MREIDYKTMYFLFPLLQALQQPVKIEYFAGFPSMKNQCEVPHQNFFQYQFFSFNNVNVFKIFMRFKHRIFSWGSKSDEKFIYSSGLKF